MKRILLYAGLVFLGLTILLLITIRFRFGGGMPYPPLEVIPNAVPPTLEVVATLDQPPGNVAVNSQNRIFFTLHPEGNPKGPVLLEWKNDQAVPYPSPEEQPQLQSPLGVFIDTQDRLWVLDHGRQGFGQPRLLGYNLANDSLEYSHYFQQEIALKGSFFNDLQVDAARGVVYISDVGFLSQKPALVIHDLASRTSRRVLENHPSLLPQNWLIQHPKREMTAYGGMVSLQLGVDGLALSEDGRWLYYAAMNHTTLFRISTFALLDTGLPAKLRAQEVDSVGVKPLSDGLSIDTLQGIYLTDVEHSRILRRDSAGELTTLIQDPERIRWADGCSFGGDGYLYFTDSALPDVLLRNRRQIADRAPYYIYRVKPPYGGIAGR
jgi:sugar lactone lactonase YvrE